MNTLNDLRPTYVLRKYSTTLLLAALLDHEPAPDDDWMPELPPEPEPAAEPEPKKGKKSKLFYILRMKR